MKFILIVEKKDMQSDGQGFVKTLKSFYYNFKNIQQFMDDILNATSFVITRNS